MCGIFGFSHFTDVTRRMVPFLALEMEFRGRDSWGATDGTRSVRRLGCITNTWWDAAPEVLAWERGIFHTRGASTGSVTLANAHPFQFTLRDEAGGVVRDVIGVHNGIVSNHENLAKKYNRSSEVDSMHIFQHLAEGKETEEIHGWGNIAWYTSDEEFPSGTLRLLRFNSEALHVAKLTTGEIVFASVAESITRAAGLVGSGVRKFYNIHPETVYRVEISVENEWVLFERNVKMQFGTRGTMWNHTSTHTPYSFDRRTSYYTPAKPPTLATLQHSDRIKHICLIPMCEKLVAPSRREGLVCKKHLDEIMKDAGYLEW